MRRLRAFAGYINADEIEKLLKGRKPVLIPLIVQQILIKSRQTQFDSPFLQWFA
jgi:hypothetical protein